MDCRVEHGQCTVSRDEYGLRITSHCHRGQRSFVEKCKMGRSLVRPDIDIRHDVAENVPNHLLMQPRDRHDPFGIAVLGDGKRKRATAKFGAIGLFVQALENELELVSRRSLRFQGLMKRAYDSIVALLQIGCNEMVLGRKVAIERCLGYVRFVDDSIYPDGANAFTIKKRTGGCQDLMCYGLFH